MKLGAELIAKLMARRLADRTTTGSETYDDRLTKALVPHGGHRRRTRRCGLLGRIGGYGHLHKQQQRRGQCSKQP